MYNLHVGILVRGIPTLGMNASVATKLNKEFVELIQHIDLEAQLCHEVDDYYDTPCLVLEVEKTNIEIDIDNTLENMDGKNYYYI